MKYEATIHFEVKDEDVNLARLIADQEGRRPRPWLIGRTDDGEVASEMDMGWGGTVNEDVPLVVELRRRS